MKVKVGRSHYDIIEDITFKGELGKDPSQERGIQKGRQGLQILQSKMCIPYGKCLGLKVVWTLDIYLFLILEYLHIYHIYMTYIIFLFVYSI